SAAGARSRSRNGDGSSASKSCRSSRRWSSMSGPSAGVTRSAARGRYRLRISFLRLVPALVVRILGAADVGVRDHAVAADAAEVLEALVPALLHERAHPRHELLDHG